MLKHCEAGYTYILGGADITAPIGNSPTPHPVTIESSNVDDGDSNENVTFNMNSCFSNLVAFIPIR